MKRLLIPVALFGAIALSLATASPALADSPRRRPVVIPSVTAQALNPNPYIAPGLTLQQYAYNTAVIGRALSTVPPYAFGYNPYPAVINYGPVYRSPYVNPYLVTPSFYYSPYPSVSPYFP
jgi:hypothetical protein